MIRNVPNYLILMLAATGLYLTIEIPFSVYLVRLLGTSASAEDIETVERVGRLLTGIAAALAYVGLRVFPRHHKWHFGLRYSVEVALIHMAVIVPLVYGALWVYGEAAGEFSSGASRKEAFIANLARRSLAESGIGAIGPSTDPVRLGLVAGLPALFSADDLVSMSGKSLEELALDEARRTLGEPVVAQRAFDAELRAAMDATYDEYSRAESIFRRAIDDVDVRAESEWQSYKSRRDSYFRFGLPKPGTRSHRQAIDMMREKGLELPYGFALDDKATFLAIMRKRIARAAFARFSEGFDDAVGSDHGIVPGMDRAAFFSDGAVQRGLRARLGLEPASTAPMLPGMPARLFAEEVYPQIVRRAADAILYVADLNGGAFTSSAHGDTGRAAAMAARLPATALLLSLAGAVFHLYKFAGYAFAIFAAMSNRDLLRAPFSRHVFASAILLASLFGMRAGASEASLEPLRHADRGIYQSLVAGAVRLQPGMFRIGSTMADAGPWTLIGALLPEAGARASAVAITSAPSPLPGAVPVPTPSPVRIALADGVRIPVPSPAPRRAAATDG